MEKEDIAAAFSSSCCARDCIPNVTPNFIRQFQTHFGILNEKHRNKKDPDCMRGEQEIRINYNNEYRKPLTLMPLYFDLPP